MSLQINNLVGFGGGSLFPITLSYESTDESGSNSTVYNFSNQGIGTASSDRLVVVGIVTSDSSSEAGSLPTGVTIGGNSATLIYGFASGAFERQAVSFWYLAVPSGTTASIQVTMSDAQVRCAIAVYRVTGGRNTLTSRSSDGNSNSTNNPSTSISFSSSNVGITGLIGQGTGGSFSWNNATVNVADVSFDNANGSYSFATITGGATVDCNCGNTRVYAIGSCIFG